MLGRAVDGMCGLAGRERVVRAARFALHRARLDLPNRPAHNGEYALQRWLLTAVPGGRPVTVLDIGANVGDWSRALLAAARATHRLDRLRLHAFEPSPSACRVLAAVLPTTARVVRAALSDRSGDVALHLVGPRAGTNSLHPSSFTGADPATTEVVPATTIDTYLRDEAIDRVDLLKIDTEGHDLRVLRGAERAFRSGTIGVAQFEYNHRWVHARHFLKDAFDLLGPLGYRIGKLTPRAVEWYEGWDPDLETFVEGNYLACADVWAGSLPGIRWWKSIR